MSFQKKLKKEKQKKEFKQNKLLKWWRKNNYKVWRVILFPIWIFQLLHKKYKKYKNDSMVFSNKVCKKYLDKMIPIALTNRVSSWESIDCFTISNVGDFSIVTFSSLGGLFDNYFRRHRCKKEVSYIYKFYKQVEKYIIDEYQIDGYNKEKMTNYKEWRSVKDKLGWKYIPCCSDDGSIGVVFYKDEYIVNEVK